MAFLIAPRKDGRVLTKDGHIIDVNDRSTKTGKQFILTLPEDLPVKAQSITRPYINQLVDAVHDICFLMQKMEDEVG